MKRFVFVATLLFSFVTQNALADSYKNIETKVNGDLHYMIAYNDNLKQDVKTFWVWHLPEKNKELFKDTKIEENVSMSNLDSQLLKSNLSDEPRTTSLLITQSQI